jgi:hypothetical protein
MALDGQKATIIRMFTLQKELDLLNAFLMSDLMSSVENGNLNINMQHIIDTYIKNITELVTHHGLADKMELYNANAMDTIKTNVGVSLMGTDIPQLELSSYEKWKAGQPNGQYHIGYYSAYALDKIKGSSNTAKNKPVLAMDNFNEQITMIRDIDKASTNKRPKR